MGRKGFLIPPRRSCFPRQPFRKRLEKTFFPGPFSAEKRPNQSIVVYWGTKSDTLFRSFREWVGTQPKFRQKLLDAKSIGRARTKIRIVKKMPRKPPVGIKSRPGTLTWHIVQDPLASAEALTEKMGRSVNPQSVAQIKWNLRRAGLTIPRGKGGKSKPKFSLIDPNGEPVTRLGKVRKAILANPLKSPKLLGSELRIDPTFITQIRAQMKKEGYSLSDLSHSGFRKKK